jgi:hypothetical protein
MIVSPNTDGDWTLWPSGERVRLMRTDSHGELRDINPDEGGHAVPVPTEANLLQEFEAILAENDADIPRLNSRMDAIQISLRRPVEL